MFITYYQVVLVWIISTAIRRGPSEINVYHSQKITHNNYGDS